MNWQKILDMQDLSEALGSIIGKINEMTVKSIQKCKKKSKPRGLQLVSTRNTSNVLPSTTRYI